MTTTEGALQLMGHLRPRNFGPGEFLKCITALDLLDIETAGGLKAVLDRIGELEAIVTSAVGSSPPGAKESES